MKFIILAAVVALSVAAPTYPVQQSYGHPVEVVPILRDDRHQTPDGTYSVDVETGNGITLSESGSPSGPEGAVVAAGNYIYTAPDGSLIEVKYVADENGYQPESAALPVAPEFPHPIPQFVLDQIAKAAQEDAAKAKAQTQYGAPPPPPSYF